MHHNNMFTIIHSSCVVICVALISCGCGSLSKQMDDGVMNAQTCANYSTMLGVVGTPGVSRCIQPLTFGLNRTLLVFRLHRSSVYAIRSLPQILRRLQHGNRDAAAAHEQANSTAV